VIHPKIYEAVPIRAGLVYPIIAFGWLSFSYLEERQRTKEAIKATIKILYTILPVLVFAFSLMGIIQD
jgi:hypothetical protein